MADAKTSNEHTRLVVLLTVLAIAAAVAAVRFLGGGGMTGGETGSSGLEYTAKNLPRWRSARAVSRKLRVRSPPATRLPFAHPPPRRRI
ncbi:MAG: hypothetical protein E4H44_00680 [Candidatus Aminicenantes bacterium]|nr:MAG: hypothetical protein E4H44_00680 [Candidatus Aminicenantes bacterium]